VLPHLLELTGARSIVDVGCGVGTWLAAARELGVRDLLGLDGTYVDRRMLEIPEECFRAVDLMQPLAAERIFDVALCLEVGEHLPESKADVLVESLTRLAPVVLYSAAVPRQGGENHVNEQWQTWWVDRFRKFEYVALDCIRRRVWDDPQVEWWYAQNILLMVRQDRLLASAALMRESEKSCGPVAIVHPAGYLNRLNGTESLHPRGFTEWISAGPSLTAASLRRLLSRR
jgi:SAM-dependent methyltransferase